MSTGFVKASSNNLPSVDMFMVMHFIKNDERFNAAEFRNAKTTAATREIYGDNAVGYVELKREGSLCTLQCKICPEHKVRSKNYTVVLIVNEKKEEIVNVSCNDCPASSGGCKHSLAFLLWVHRRSEDAAPTEITSYWVKPRLATICTSKKFIEAADFATASDDIPEVASDNFKTDLVNVATRAQLQGQILKYTSEEEGQEVNFRNLSIYTLLFRFHAAGGVQYKEFLTFAAKELNMQMCNDAEKSTKGQSESPLWHELRFGRVTASKLHEFAHCKTENGTLVENIIGAYKIRDNKYMKRGRQLEKDVLKTVAKKLKMNFSECGFFIVPEYPLFGALPDGLSAELVVEVNCSINQKTFKHYIHEGQIGEQFKAQLQLQMLCAQKKRGIFCIAQPDYEKTKNVDIVFVDFDINYIKN